MRFRETVNRLFGLGPVKAPPGGSSAQHASRREQIRRDAVVHDGVLSEQFARTLEAADQGLTFPATPQDPLEYLGNIEPLGLTEHEKETVRQWTLDLVEERGDRAVWNSRLRLKLELRYLMSEGGLQKMPGRKEPGGGK